MEAKKAIIGFFVALVLMASLAINQVQLGGKPVDISVGSLAVVAGCKSLGTIQTTAEVYTCDADTCEVYGLIKCDTSMTTPKVDLRCGDGWFAWDQYGAGSLNYYSPTTMTVSQSQPFTKVKCCPDGSCIYQSVTGQYLYGKSLYTSGTVYSQKAAPSTNIMVSSPLAGYENRESYASGASFSCNWNFCPATDPTHPLCSKSESSVSSWSKATTEYSSVITLNKGASISFRPTDGKGVLLSTDKSTFVVSRYDCSCINECTLGKKQCIGANTYATCTASTTGGCNSFVGVSSCPPSQLCKVTTSGGECGCDSNQCAEGARVCDSTSSYKTCQRNSAGCTYWSSSVLCPKDKVQLECNPDTSSSLICISPKTEICTLYETKCTTGSQYVECVKDSNGANYWSTTTKSCPTDAICSNGACTICNDNNICTQDTALSGKCQFSAISNCCKATSDCGAGNTCTMNRCTKIVGYCSSNSECASPKVCDLTSHSCICPTTGDYCDAEGYTKCIDSTHTKICQRESVSGCLKWTAYETCSGGQICIENSPAKCVVPANLYFDAQPSYPIGQKLSFIVKASNSVGDLAGNQVYTTLADENGNVAGTAQCLLSKNLLTNDYSCTVEYLAGVSTTGQYSLKAEVSPTNLPGIKLNAQTSFNIYAGAGVGIRTDTVVYTHELAQAYLSVSDDFGSPIPMCSQSSSENCFERWMVEPRVNGQLVQYNLIPQVEAGKVKLTYSASSAGKVSIKAWTEGGQLAAKSAERTDIVAQAPEIGVEHSIPGTVNYGTNRFEFNLWAPTNDLETEKAALDVPTDGITIKVIYPDRHEESIHPMKSSKGSYFFNLDMPQDKGQAYSMTITASYSNWKTKTTPTIYVSAQSGTVTPVSGTDWPMYVIIGLGVLLVVVLVITRLRRR